MPAQIFTSTNRQKLVRARAAIRAWTGDAYLYEGFTQHPARPLGQMECSLTAYPQTTFLSRQFDLLHI